MFAAQGPKLFTRDLVRELVDIQTAPWAHLLTGSVRQQGSELAKLLKPFGIHPDNFRQGGSGWGYLAADFEDALARYLPPLEKSSEGPDAEAA